MAGPAAKLKTRSWDWGNGRSWIWVWVWDVAAHLIEMGLVVRLRFRWVVVVVLKLGFLRKGRVGFLRRRVLGEVAKAMVLLLQI